MSDNIQKDPQVILCEMCTEEDRKPARKTCMKCEISMCVQHLQAHLTTPVLLQTHPLTEPMSACGTTKCPQHGKLLEYYCLDDMTCVCVSCAIEDQHRLHNMKTFSTAHKELMEKLNAEQQALLVKTDDENVSLEKWEKSEREKLGHSSVRLIEAVTKLRDMALTSVQSSVSARMTSLKTSKNSMQAAQNEKDAYRFLQMYSQVRQDVEKAKAVNLRKGLEPGTDRDKLVKEMRENGEKMVKQADDLWGSLLTLVDPENHQELLPTTSRQMFEPKNLSPAMSLSKDKRMVFYNSWLGQCSATLLISSTQSVHSLSARSPNIQRWAISLSRDYDWTIGLCDKDSVNNIMGGTVYGLCCKDNKLSSLMKDYQEFGQQKTVLSALVSRQDEDEAQPEMVEVFWNVVASSLSFFSRCRQHQSKEIITIKMSLDTLNLVPFVQLVERSQNMSQPQLQLQKAYDRSDSQPNRMYSYVVVHCSYQDNCCCEACINSVYSTEVVCELQ
ncbi:tripartite motif-containing protein 16-like [Larimichthys crocea]|uniref:tripartite motif-containing protein 16-like n=1 Tax=Larimichthys crocea TaxID=215358 RepID=UPI000F5F920A|nr:tripartite motif-containing protein 16-like [Larimichthys crocea]